MTDTPIKKRAGGPKKKSKKPIITIIVLVIVAFAAWSFLQYQQTLEQVEKLSTPEGREELEQKDTEELIAQVGSHLLLPEGEVPTVATITDVEALTLNQPFFIGAQNGDRVLIYIGARKAIIYSPERDILVNVGSVVVDDSGQANLDVGEAVGGGQVQVDQ